jgi:lysyl-tRNA synthetase, class II
MFEPNEIERARLRKVEALRQCGIEPWPRSAERTHTTAEAIQAFEAGPEGTPIDAAVVGRLRSIRIMGKAAFAHVEDGHGKLQIYLRRDDVGPERLALFQSAFDLGDFVQASGYLFRTRTGEISLHVRDFAMLAKAISPLPASKEELVDGQRVVHSAFANPEARYRERYADLAVNPEVREVFRTRARIVSALRRFLDSRGFLEVETPVLQPIYGGAAARPFTTQHNQLHQTLFLRISFELYLKRLLVGGYERVYEIGRDFRNEGISFKHNPEFTQLEFYMAYADYHDVMRLTEEMFAFVTAEVHGSDSFRFQGQEICVAPPWPRVPLYEAIAEHSGIDPARHPTLGELRRAMEARGLSVSPTASRGRLIDSLFGSFVEPKLIQPAFVVDYPREISPLAKSKPDAPGMVERFEGFVGGMELCNAFTELNDPLDQETRFRELGREDEAGDEEHHPMDEDYLQAMRYGMPPNGGFGMGIDRLTMLLTDRSTIREVLLFPHLRSRDDTR